MNPYRAGLKKCAVQRRIGVHDRHIEARNHFEHHTKMKTFLNLKRIENPVRTSYGCIKYDT